MINEGEKDGRTDDQLREKGWEKGMINEEEKDVRKDEQ